MRTQVSPENPFNYDRYGFAWEHVPTGGKAHLDFGCGGGSFLAALTSKQIGRLVGVDRDRRAVAEAQQRYPDIEIVHSTGLSLPLGDGQFSSVSALDVIEHVDDQIGVLRELRRVLSNDGTLIVTVPGRHLFSFLDMGNLKFRFPRLHRWYYCHKHSVAEYQWRYVSNPDGLVGDVSAQKRRHEHFSRNQLGNLLGEAGFAVVQFDGAGFFYRPIRVVSAAVGRFGPFDKVLRRIERVDAKRFGSANVFCTGRSR